MHLPHTVPEAGSEEAFQEFLTTFGSEKSNYTTGELGQFYADILVLAEILIDLYEEKERKKRRPVNGMPPIPMLARPFDSVRFPRGIAYEPPWGSGFYRFDEGLQRPIKIKVSEK